MVAPNNSNPKQELKDPGQATGVAFLAEETRSPDWPQVIVGVGAPAGGLDFLRKLFAGVPTGSGQAFILVQHAGPSQIGLTADLLQDHTALKVAEAEEGLIAEAGHLYVIPVNRHLTLVDGRMSLVEPAQCHGLCLPIDHFFCTLAADQKTRAVGIVLSGTGSDGTIGLSEIKAAGGRTIVEDPKSAEFTDLQPNTITAGVADQTLPLEKIPEALLDIAARIAHQDRTGVTGKLDADFRAILNILLIRTGHDFRCYKKTTLIRRIRRRMALTQLKHPADYRSFLEEHPDEARLLHKDLLIGVTDFFRQPEAWRLLEEKVIPVLIANADPENPVRVWVPGCSSGKEAYSLAILLAEQVEASGKPISIQIFATDTDEDALNIARSGTYPEDDLGANISPERRKTFFIHKNGQFQVIKALRELVVFAPQNLTSDPPFSRLDLISCRNLLIYLDRDIQRQIIALFHFALREGGFLFLGNAETITGHEELFNPVFKKWRIYRRIGVGRRMPLELPVGKVAGGRRTAALIPSRPNSLVLVAQQVLTDRFAPTAVIVDRRQQLLYAHGAAEDYLTIPGGETTMNIVDLARDGLRTRLGAVIRKVVETNRTAGITTRIRRGSKSFPVKATVTPLHQPREVDGLLLISFEEYQPRMKQRTAHEYSAAGETDLQHLEDELKITQEELQGTIEQLEGSNEELKASNEEAIASNEELQSANEELETSKEELQSLNEELNTVNIRLHEKVDELESANNDVTNLLGSTSIATIFLDRDFKVMRYTPAITRLLSLIPSDVGRPIVDITRKFVDDALLSDARQVLADLTPKAMEIQAEDGRWYIRRITPYRTQDDRIEGVVVTFLDVHDLKQSEQERERLASFPLLNPQPIIEADLEGNVHFLNPSAQRLLPDLEQRGSEHPWLADWESIARACREDGTNLITREVIVGERTYQQTIHYVSEVGRIRIYGAEITKRKRAENLLSENENRLKRSQEIAHLGSWELDVATNLLTWSDEVYRIFGLQPQEFGASYEAFLEAVHPDDRAAVDAAYSGSLQEGKDTYEIEHRVVRKSTGEIRYVHEKCEHVRDETGRIIRSAGMVHDITERKLAEEALHESERRYRHLFESMDEGFAHCEMIYDEAGKPADFRYLDVNPAFARLTGLPVEQVLKRTVKEVIPGIEPFWIESFDRVLQSGWSERIDNPVAELGKHYEAYAWRSAAGRFAVVFSNVTERKRAEEAILRAKEEWERTFDSVPDLIAILDDQHRIVRMNKAMAERLGCSSEVCVGLRCHEQVHGTGAPPAFCPHVLTLADGQEHVAEVHEEHLGGDFLVSTTPVFDARGGLIGTVHVARDITERKKLEDEIRRSRDELEIRVRERTAELAVTNKGLVIEIIERKKAEEALQRSKRQLRSLAAQLITAQENERKRIALEVHDVLGSSLSAIKFKVEEALHGNSNGKGAHISESLEAVIPLVQETIEVARRIQSDLRPPLLDDLGIAATFSWFCRRFETIYSGIQVILEMSIPEDELSDFLKVVIFRIAQEAMNNIGKHAGATLVHLQLRKLDGTVELTIKDNGAGFDREGLDAGEPLKKGLGLASMKERAEFSGGSFSLESTMGQGTLIKAVWPVD